MFNPKKKTQQIKNFMWLLFSSLTLLVFYFPTYLLAYLSIYIYIFVSKIQLICHVATFAYATCHNPRPSKKNNHNGQWILIFQKNHENPHSATC